MSDWIRSSESLPTHSDGNEKSEVWVDDGLQVRLVPWAHVNASAFAYWQPCPVRRKPGRAEKMTDKEDTHA